MFYEFLENQIHKTMTLIEFNTQLTKLEDYLRRYALILTANNQDADDLLQDTYLRALDFKDMFISSKYKNLKGWTYTIMKNIFINNYRRAKKLKGKMKDITIDNPPVVDKNAYENLYSMLQLKDMNMAINNLEDNQKMPLKLHLSGFTYKEIAEKLGVNIGTIKSRIFFARKNLKSMF